MKRDDEKPVLLLIGVIHTPKQVDSFPAIRSRHVTEDYRTNYDKVFTKNDKSLN